MPKTLRDELQELLSEDAGFAISRAWETFGAAAGPRRVVLVGAGRLGTNVVAAMEAGGMHPPLAFADNNRHKHGQPHAGIRVMSIESAAALYRDAIFVVTIWGANSAHRIQRTEQQLRSLGLATAPFLHLLWACDRGLPHFGLDRPAMILTDRANVLRAFELLADDESRQLFVANVRARLTGQIDQLPEPSTLAAYLPGDVYAPRDDERIVDGGAFDGDTLRSWIRSGRPFERWTAIEPHPINAHAFRRNQQALGRTVADRVKLYDVALDANAGTLRMTPEAGLNAHASTDPSGPEVSAVQLDQLAFAADATLIKLDIEGAEPQALLGMERTVRDQAPVLAVCVYHKQHHLWTVPLAMAAMRDDYALFLRAHGAEGWDLVCYVVPAARRLDARAA